VVQGERGYLTSKGKVAACLQAWRLCFFHNSGRVWVVSWRLVSWFSQVGGKRRRG
jgi:hypothetical protein